MDRTIDSKTKNHITNISLFMQTTVIFFTKRPKTKLLTYNKTKLYESIRNRDHLLLYYTNLS